MEWQIPGYALKRYAGLLERTAEPSLPIDENFKAMKKSAVTEGDDLTGIDIDTLYVAP